MVGTYRQRDEEVAKLQQGLREAEEREKSMRWRLHTAFNHAHAYKKGKPHQKERLLSMLITVLDAQMFCMVADNELELEAMMRADRIIREAVGVTDDTLRIIGADPDDFMCEIPEIRISSDGDTEDVVAKVIGGEEE